MIAILINSLPSAGAERIALNIASHLKVQGKNVIMLVLTRIENQYESKHIDIQYLSNSKNLKKGYSLGKFINYPLLIFRLIKFIRDYKVELVQSHLFSASIINVIASILGSKHEVQIVNHSSVGYEKNVGIGGLLKMFWLRFAYKRANLLISISEKMKADINHIILKNNKINHFVIPNPHDIESILKKSSESVADFKFDSSKKYLVTAGRLVKLKRIEVLIQALSIFSKEYDNYELIILGDGKEKQNLTTIAVESGVGKKVHFLGNVDNPFKYIAKSDIYILSSETEGLPNALIEGMICGIPVISTDCSTGPREILAPKTDYNVRLTDDIEIAEYGILTPVGNVELLVKALKTLISQPDFYHKKSQEASVYVKKYDINIIMNEYEKVLFHNQD